MTGPQGPDEPGLGDALGGGRGADRAATERFRRTARVALDVLLEHDPVLATTLGDHRFDDRLPDLSAEGVEAQLRDLADATAALDDVDDSLLGPQDVVDLELLRTRLTARQWAVGEHRAFTRDPLLTLPGDAVYALVARDTGDPDERARALAARLRAVPASLAQARSLLGRMPRVAVETAVDQTRGAVRLLAELDEPGGLLERAPERLAEVDDARTAAAQALEQHAGWLADRLPEADGDPRLGEQAFAARLWYVLDTETGPEALLDRAESDLMAVEEAIDETAAELAPLLGITAGRHERVRAVLDAVAAAAPVTDADVLARCRGHLDDLSALVLDHQLVTVPEELLATVQVIEMPPVRRGVAVAYCDAPGALEPGAPPTFFAVSPTPDGWDADRVASFYREYNDHMLRDLTVHEAMPGHVLQLAHARRFRGSTPARAALWSGTFVEGWAVHAEQLVADAVEAAAPGTVEALSLRMQQLKMRLRSTINAILDVRVHARGMTQDEAMALMTRRGHQEDGEAAGKWRRALLTSAQLSTYYVGASEVGSLAGDLAAGRPGAAACAVHDELLSHGSPSPRLLRLLLDLD